MILKVAYPVGGIANCISAIEDLCYGYIEGKKSVVIVTAVQPNSIPHLGSVVTLCSAFAFADRIKQKYDIPVTIQLDELENSTGKSLEIEGRKYVYSLENSQYDNTRNMSDVYMGYFVEILNRLKKITEIDYSVRKYRDFQSDRTVRKSIINIYREHNVFLNLFNPGCEKIHMRVPCKICGLTDKTYESTIHYFEDGELYFESSCPIHGVTKIHFTEDNKEYVDMNTQLRDITKGAMCMSYSDTDCLPIMFDGGDWGGVWDNRIHCYGLIKLGYKALPLRVFAPLITDWSGAKFSKSLYVDSQMYEYLQGTGFSDYKDFMNKYGEGGFNFLWNEVKDWATKPERFFRNYSLQYIIDKFQQSVG